jgi:hypothetical protein
MKENIIEWTFELKSINKVYIVLEGQDGKLYTLNIGDTLTVGIPIDISVT